MIRVEQEAKPFLLFVTQMIVKHYKQMFLNLGLLQAEVISLTLLKINRRFFKKVGDDTYDTLLSHLIITPSEWISLKCSLRNSDLLVVTLSHHV